ncbi:hypothetical protein BCR34DRAFT_591901 [Clohesyomyces aquaticus]|uniref:RBR-type E3 ubiquitin transferase n=1 Tax=Clohesyomyces aquaticus TaxID=1231657 RepID=A0A1Y1YWQ5_9PLEO|nr:hypothetical protein BCR34DRAFT_591901 [Clohesyomyces aquaticus]
MGQSVTKLPDLPAPHKARRPDGSSTRKSRQRALSYTETENPRGSLKTTLWDTHPGPAERHNGHRRSRALSETDGNSRHAAASSWARHHKSRSTKESGRQPLRQRDLSPGARRRRAKPRTSRLDPEEFARHRTPPRGSKSKSGVAVSEQIELEDLGPKRDCLVCTESRPLRRFPKRPPTALCTHEINTCKHCLRNWIRSEFKSKVWDQIHCPECRVHMQYEDVRDFAPSDVFRRYDKLSTKAALEAIPGFRWCTTKGCKSGQVHDETNSTPKFKCVSCKVEYCVVHNRRWHKGETCAQFDYRTDDRIKKAEEEASKKKIKETAKKCPGCKYNIEKTFGCDHMTCSKCRHEFCWTCLAPYGPIREQGNRQHRPRCTHYA